MKARLSATAFCLAALGCLVAPGGAAAKSGHLVLRPGRTAEIKLPRSHGYTLRVLTRGRRTVSIVAVKPRPTSVVTYRAKGHVRDGRIEADLGRLGRIDVDFRGGRPKPQPSEPGLKCKGRRPLERKGVFSGTIRVHGQRGFVDVSVKHARGRLVRSFRQVCKTSISRATRRREAGSEMQSTQLEARSHAHGRRISFTELALAEEAPSIANAKLHKRVGRVDVSETALVVGSAGIEFSDPGSSPETATVSPPSPFSGSATYSRGGTTASWTGSLAVLLPGSGRVPLTGSGFHATLCEGSLSILTDGCP